MGIGISRQQQGLVHQHGTIPDRRRATQTWQSHPGDHRLDKEKQKTAGQDRDEEQRPAVTRGACGHMFARRSRAACAAW